MFWRKRRRKPEPVPVDIVKMDDKENPFAYVYDDPPDDEDDDCKREPYIPPAPKQLADTPALQREVKEFDRLGAPKLDKIHEIPVGVLLAQVETVEEKKVTPEDRDMPTPTLVPEPCKKCADTKAPQYYVLYDYDDEITAVGPFVSKTNARCWASGMRYLTDDSDYRVIGVVSELVNFGSLNIVAPELGDG